MELVRKAAMSKRAEKAALKAYPYNRAYSDNDVEYDGNFCNRIPYIEGYEQAEKDYIKLAQLWVGSGDANIMSFKQFLKCHETQSNK